jgi:hypothetical protein
MVFPAKEAAQGILYRLTGSCCSAVRATVQFSICTQPSVSLPITHGEPGQYSSVPNLPGDDISCYMPVMRL